MGAGRKPMTFRSCPVGTVLKDEVIVLLAAYNVAMELGQWPPGRRDPRVLDAFMVIRDENNAVEAERKK
jgi:hypothetical protein